RMWSSKPDLNVRKNVLPGKRMRIERIGNPELKAAIILTTKNICQSKCITSERCRNIEQESGK
ncbi:MAG: hypothetical protein K2O40_00320, partial [Lachnospiraceae bacterium]|nr:hypothetical protein [Lachnospiraceae bacterium]